MLSLATSVSSSHLGFFAALVGFGFLLGTVGHIIRSRTAIVTGILIVCMVSCYYVFVLSPVK